MKKLIFIASILFSFNAFAQNITASVNKTKIGFNDPLILTISIQNQTGDSPILKPLEKDFEIVATKNLFNSQIINGVASQKLQYILTLRPKKEGKLTIPSLVVGADITNPINIEVTSGSQVATTPNAPELSFEGIVEKTSAYVQEEINFSVVLTDDGNTELTEPRFADTKDFIIKSLGDPEIKAIVKNNQNMRQITFDFALFAQKSGLLTIPSFEVQGFAIEQIDMKDPFAFGIFASKKRPLSLRTTPQNINILPAPKNWDSKWWLPAQDIELKSEFITTDFEINSPIKRNIIIQSKGVLETQLPDIIFKNKEGIKQYPGQSQSVMSAQNKEIIATKEIMHTYIPTQNGEIILPAIEIEWFDVNNNQIKKASLKEEAIFVKGSPNKQEIIKEDPATKNIAKENNIPAKKAYQKEKNTSLYLIIIASFGFGLVAGFLLNRYNKKTNYKKLVTSSKTPKELETNLILWAQKKYKNILNLKDIANQIDEEEFKILIEKLSNNLYNNQTDFNIKEFIKSFKKIANKKEAIKQQATLPNLYN